MTSEPLRPLNEREPLEEAKEAPKKGDEVKTRVRRPRSSSSPAETDLRARLADPLRKVAEWVETRDPELGMILREDSGKMAALLAKVAVSSQAPGVVTNAIRAIASALEPLDAFGRTIGLLFTRWRQRRAERRARIAEEELLAPFPEPVYGDEPSPMPETPERFRADTEPPPVD